MRNNSALECFIQRCWDADLHDSFPNTCGTATLRGVINEILWPIRPLINHRNPHRDSAAPRAFWRHLTSPLEDSLSLDNYFTARKRTIAWGFQWEPNSLEPVNVSEINGAATGQLGTKLSSRKTALSYTREYVHATKNPIFQMTMNLTSEMDSLNISW